MLEFSRLIEKPFVSLQHYGRSRSEFIQTVLHNSEMTMRTLTIFLLGLIILSCQTIESKSETSVTTTPQSTEPDYQVALKFINDYLDYSNDLKSQIGQIEWIESRTDITTEFKIELKRTLKEAEENDPELGLGFDPILEAQDNPNEFEIDKTDSEFLIVKGIDWPDFLLTLKVKLVDNKWLVDGAGIINVPANKRIKR